MRVVIGATLVLGLLGTACEDTQRESFEAPDALETTPAAAPEGEVGDASPAARDAAALMVRSGGEHGEYLTDGAGLALYVLAEDPEGESICYDECAEEWPPLLLAARSTPRAGGADVRETLIGTIERRDGRTQVTYAGQPLYYYHDDESPGDTHGHHVTDAWGEWYLVRPDGEHIGH